MKLSAALQEGLPTNLQDLEKWARDAEREIILDTLNSLCWHRKKAAASLNIEYKALLYKMRVLGIGRKSRSDQRDCSEGPGNTQDHIL